MKEFGFEKLEVWKNSKQLTIQIYKLSKSFPDDEKYGLISQLRRAVVSVNSNIAEGASRISSKDQAHFYHLAYSSLMEVLSQILISIELGYIEKENESVLRAEISKISNQLNALRNSALKKVKK